MLDWHGSGMSVMEMSHRGKEFIAHRTRRPRRDLRELLAIPANYKVLFLQGGATLQFAHRADEPAARQGKRRLRQHRRVVEEGDQGSEAATARSTSPRAPRTSDFTYVPAAARRWKLDPDAAYVHYCANETIGGVEFHWTPDTGDVPLVADMSSHILSRPIDVAQFGADLRRRAEEHRPGGPHARHRARRPARPGAAGHAVGVRLQGAGRRRLDAQHAADLRDLHRRPGVPVAASSRAAWRRSSRATSRKAKLLYDYLDAARFYTQPGGEGRPLADERAVHAARRRRSTRRSSKGAKARGLVQLKGHRSVGGMRASIYNAMPIEGVQRAGRLHAGVREAAWLSESPSARS